MGYIALVLLLWAMAALFLLPMAGESKVPAAAAAHDHKSYCFDQ